MIFNHYVRPLAVIALTVALAGCGRMQRQAEETVRQSLKDPDSARFGTFYYNDATKRACLTVNARNSMGGYTGNRQVELQHDPEGWRWVSENEFGEDTCKGLWADSKD